jgi:hypothetical protein
MTAGECRHLGKVPLSERPGFPFELFQSAVSGDRFDDMSSPKRLPRSSLLLFRRLQLDARPSTTPRSMALRKDQNQRAPSYARALFGAGYRQ